MSANTDEHDSPAALTIVAALASFIVPLALGILLQWQQVLLAQRMEVDARHALEMLGAKLVDRLQAHAGLNRFAAADEFSTFLGGDTAASSYLDWSLLLQAQWLVPVSRQQVVARRPDVPQELYRRRPIQQRPER